MAAINVKYHSIIANYFASQPNFFDGELQKQPHTRKCMEQPWQQTKAEMWDEVTDTLCDLNFIQAKACAKQTYDLVKDYHFALDGLPEYQPEKEKERKRQERLDKYTRDLIACAEGKISRFDLEVPESITPWTQEQIDAEIERIKTNPTRADKLKDFFNFLGNEANNLQNYAYQLQYFVIQQAWNFANDGWVANSAKELVKKVNKILVLRKDLNRPLWNPSNPILKVLGQHKYGVDYILATQDWKKCLVGSSNGQKCYLWDLEQGKLIRSWFLGEGKLTNLSISEDGKRVLTCSYECNLWDLETGKLLKTIADADTRKTINFLTQKGKPNGSKNISAITSGSLYSNGKKAFTNANNNVCILWDLETGEKVKTLIGHDKLNDILHEQSVYYVNISPDGKRALTQSWDKTKSSILWDMEKGEVLRIFRISFRVLTPNYKIALTSSGKTLTLWDLDTGVPIRNLSGLLNTESISAISTTPDGRLALIGSKKGYCSLLNLETGTVLKSFKTPHKWVKALSLSPDGTKALSSSWGGGNCILWNIERGHLLELQQGHTDTVLSVSISSDSKWAISGSQDNTCIVWNLDKGQPQKILRGHTSRISTVSILPDNMRALSGSWDNTCILWDIKSGQPIHHLIGHSDLINVLCITPDGKRALTGSKDSSCILWDLSTGQPLLTLTGHEAEIMTMCLTPNGKLALTGSRDNSCILWDIESGNPVHKLKGHRSTVNVVCITPDGKRALTGSSDNNCILWDLGNGRVLKKFRNHSKDVQALNIAPDGKRAISVQGDDKFIFWNLVNGKRIGSSFDFMYYSRNNASVSISSDGKKLITSTSEGEIFLWDSDNWNVLAVYLPESNPTILTLFNQGILIGNGSGIVEIVKINNNLLNSGPGIVTIRQIWDFDLKCHQKYSVDCPFCGNRFYPNQFIVNTIRDIIDKHKIKGLNKVRNFFLRKIRLNDSLYNLIPKEIWDSNDLISNCPNCGEKLKFNPFIAGGNNYD